MAKPEKSCSVDWISLRNCRKSNSTLSPSGDAGSNDLGYFASQNNSDMQLPMVAFVEAFGNPASRQSARNT
jgi:hypothetical protein